MYVTESKVRVRYGESDRMGYAYYGNYPLYYEVGRTEMLRALGLTYKEMEDDGIILPVINLQSNYLSAAFYDDLLTIKTSLIELPAARIRFEYEIFNEKGEKLNFGETTLVFTDAKTRKPRRPPEYFMEKVKKFF
ncbi:MAG TPA: thioesterase family protein [Bacteroidales bacterium]